MKVQDLLPYIHEATHIWINTSANNLFSGNKKGLLENDLYLIVCSLEIDNISTQNDTLTIEI